MGIGASSVVVTLMTIAAIMIPYLYADLREKKQCLLRHRHRRPDEADRRGLRDLGVHLSGSVKG
jgi:hypothetical protein